jgi:hypothetical protein
MFDNNGKLGDRFTDHILNSYLRSKYAIVTWKFEFKRGRLCFEVDSNLTAKHAVKAFRKHFSGDMRCNCDIFNVEMDCHTLFREMFGWKF